MILTTTAGRIFMSPMILTSLILFISIIITAPFQISLPNILTMYRFLQWALILTTSIMTGWKMFLYWTWPLKILYGKNNYSFKISITINSSCFLSSISFISIHETVCNLIMAKAALATSLIIQAWPKPTGVGRR